MQEREKAQPRLSAYSSTALNAAVAVAAEKAMMSAGAWVRGAVLQRLREEGVELKELGSSQR
jgi:hypothetical protein